MHSPAIAGTVSQPLRYLLLGSKGAGMTALAEILMDAGHSVIGTDQSQMSSDNIPAPDLTHRFPTVPWSVDALNPDDTDACVYSPAVASTNPVLQHVRNAGVPTVTLHECLADVFQAKRQLCVAGTHGKTTTSAMLSGILSHAGADPSFFVGGRLHDSQTSGRFGSGPWAVLESCEFSHSFHLLGPEIAVITGIERDHFDCFPDQDSEDRAFAEFVDRVSPNGAIVANADCDRTMQVARSSGRRVVSFGVEQQTADWTADGITVSETQTSFTCKRLEATTPVRLSVPGRHNVQNALAAMAAAAETGCPPDQIATALASFSGVRRRFEYRGQVGGMVLIDDYAHHPTAIRETMLTARAVFPNRRIVAVFEPHQLVRTRSLFSDFVNSLQLADQTLLLPAFPAREEVSYAECCRVSGDLVRKLNCGGMTAFLFANRKQIVSRLHHSGRPSDVVITMGAGRTNLIHDEFTRRFQSHFVA